MLRMIVRMMGTAAAGLAAMLAGTAPGAGAASYMTAGWTQGQPPVQLIGEAEGACFLTRVSGSFRGGGEQVRVYTDKGSWWLGGSSKQDGVGGTAHCLRWNEFTFLGGGDVRWASGEFSTSMEAESCSVLPFIDFPPPYLPANTWWGDAGTYVSGVQGRFDGGGEYVRIAQSAQGSDPSQVGAGTKVCGNSVTGYARSIFVGRPQTGTLAKFHGPGTIWPATMPAAHEYAVSSAKGPAQLQLPSADQSVCYFTHVGGKLRGGGEFVELAIDGARNWRLTAQHKGGGAPDGVFARARCYALLQGW